MLQSDSVPEVWPESGRKCLIVIASTSLWLFSPSGPGALSGRGCWGDSALVFTAARGPLLRGPDGDACAVRPRLRPGRSGPASEAGGARVYGDRPSDVEGGATMKKISERFHNDFSSGKDLIHMGTLQMNCIF